MPDLDERHQRLQALLTDRKAKKGRASRVAYVCLDADLSFKLAEAEQELDVIREQVDADAKEKAHDRRLGGGGVAPDPDLQSSLLAAEQKAAAAQDAADEVTVAITITAVPADEFDELLKKHPPRDGNEADQRFGAHVNTFCDALLLGGVTRIADRDGNLVDVSFDELLPTLSSGERQAVRGAALEANQRTASIPFSVSKSSNDRGSGGRSKPRSR